jgi:AcrR family transcriptional regulator
MASDDSDDSTSSEESAGRDELIAAAKELFADLGYTGATTTAIARRAGVSQPLLYHHFDSKKGLWRAVIDELFGRLRKKLEEVARETGGADRKERLSKLLATLVRFNGRNPELSQLMRTEGRSGGEAFDELFDQWLDDLVTFFNTELTAGQDDGTLRELDPSTLYFIIVGAATEPFAQSQIARRTFEIDTTDEAFVESYADTLVDALLNGILAD